MSSPGQLSVSSNAAAGTLVSTQQSSRLQTLLSKMFARGPADVKIAQLQKYLKAGGSPDAVVYWDSKPSFYKCSSDYTGSEPLMRETLLTSFTRAAHTGAMTALLDAGANPDLLAGEAAIPADEHTALSLAAALDFIEPARLLLARGTGVNAAHGLALITACGKAHRALCRF